MSSASSCKARMKALGQVSACGKAVSASLLGCCKSLDALARSATTPKQTFQGNLQSNSGNRIRPTGTSPRPSKLPAPMKACQSSRHTQNSPHFTPGLLEPTEPAFRTAPHFFQRQHQHSNAPKLQKHYAAPRSLLVLSLFFWALLFQCSDPPEDQPV